MPDRQAAFRLRPAVAHRAATVLLGAAAWLASAAHTWAQDVPYDMTLPTLTNEDEIGQERAARYREAGVPGAAHMRFRVLVDGTVDPTTIMVEAVTSDRFAAAATEIARKLRFAPARVSGTPVAVWYRHEISFSTYSPRRIGDEDEGTYELSAVERPPMLLNAPSVARELSRRYPPEHKDAGIPGDVRLRFKVLATGTVGPYSVTAEASTDSAFETPAVAGVLGMRFSPALVAGRPVAVWLTIPIHFDIERDTPADSTSEARPSPPSWGVPPAPGTPREGTGAIAGKFMRMADEGRRRPEARR